MATTNPTLPTSSFIGNDDWRWWLGTVLNSDDKDAKLGRVKVNILGYHRPKEKPEDLPWALVMAPTDSANANGVGSAPSSLKPGSFVVGFFLDYPDCQQPVVIGTLLGKIEEVNDPEAQNRWDYPGSFENTINKNNSDVTDTGASAAAAADATKKDAVSMSTAAAAFAQSATNPSGLLVDVPIADGKNAGDKTFSSNLSYAINDIAKTVWSAREISKNPQTTLSADIDSEEQTIPVQSSLEFPKIGVIQIGSEYIGYNNKDTGKFILAKRGFNGSKAIKHKKGAAVKFIPKGDFQTGSDKGTGSKGSISGTFIETLVDIQSVVDRNLDFIEDALWWIVNQVKSFLMSEITKILNAIGIAAISPVPMFGKLLTDVILYILKVISCYLDESLMDALLSGIREAILDFVNDALSAISDIKCIVDAVFSAIFELVELGNQIFETVNELIEVLSSVGDITDLSNLSQLNITGILDFIFSLLGIGCNKDTRDPFAITFSSCPIAEILSCGGGDPFNISVKGIPGRWNPEYSKTIGTYSEVGSMISFDDTPYSSRASFIHGPSKSGIEIYDNGDVRVTNSSTKTEVVIKNNEIVVKGDYVVTVDGNYNLKVGKDMHIEVLGMYNLSVNRESKVTYAGEHKTFYKNDSRLEANNGLALVASKLGISCSGQYEIHSPIMTSWATEQNHFALGSHNVITLFQNNFVGLNKTKLVAGNNLYARVGTNFEQGLGASNIFQTGLENEWWGGQHNQIGLGVWTENKLSVDQESTIGVTAFTKAAASFDSITGAAFKDTTGLLFDTAEGVMFNTSAAVLKITAPIVSIN
jgi:hypothetical protein